MKMTRKMKKIMLSAWALLSAGAAMASANVSMQGALGSVSLNKVKIAYTITAPADCELFCVTIWSDETKTTPLYEKYLDEYNKYSTVGNHTVTFSLASAEYSVAQIKQNYPNAVVEVYADFCGDDMEYNQYDAIKLTYSRSDTSAMTIPDKVRSLYGAARVYKTALVKVGDEFGETTEGLVKFGISKHNSKGQVQVKAVIKTFFGVQENASVVVKPDDAGTIDAVLEFKTLGKFTVMAYEGNGEFDFIGTNNDDDYFFEYSTLGGKLEDGAMCFSIDPDDLPVFSDRDVLAEALPDDAALTISNGASMDAGVKPALRIVKKSETSDSSSPEYGEGWVLEGVNDTAKPNASKLTLKYNPSSGIVQGTFKVYYTNAKHTSGKPKVKTVKVTVRGVFVDGVGYGMCGMKISSKKYFFPFTIWGWAKNS